MTDKYLYNYETFFEFEYDTSMHTFAMLDGWMHDSTARHRGMIGIMIPIHTMDIGLGLGNNYLAGSLFMTYFQYAKSEFNFRSIWQTGAGKPVFKTQAYLNFQWLQIALQHINHYGVNVGANLKLSDLIIGTSYNFGHEQWQCTIALMSCAQH